MIFSIEVEGKLRRVELERKDDHYRILLDGEALDVEATLPRPGVLSLLVAGRSYRCVLDEDPSSPAIYVGHVRYPYRVDDPRSLSSRRSQGGSAAGPVSLKAPMPGRVVRLLVQEGAEVAAQQGVVVIEAMKMQNELKAPKAGCVARILVEAGATVVSGQPLAIIE